MERETMEYDVIIVGAGIAGLSAAIRLKQLSNQSQTPCRICILEKGAEVGAHILSGCVFEPRALNELLPEWQSMDTPLTTPATSDHFIFLSEKKAYRLPTPRPMHNKGNYLISLGQLCRFLAQQAESLGIEIYPGFPAENIVEDEQGRVKGILTGDMGRDKQGNPLPNFQPGIAILAPITIIAEGCRGSLAEKLMKRYQLRQHCQPQTYGIGLKEIWEISPEHHETGKVMHTIGWPLDKKTYGGSFLYHMADNKIAVGFVVGLDYQNPHLSPFNEFQRFKTHPAFHHLFENAQRLEYGARALNEGGFQSIPDLTFPGGLIIGDAAGFLNVPKIKGSHTAMKSGMVAAEAVFDFWTGKSTELDYQDRLSKTWCWKELHQVRNIRPAFRYGLLAGLAYAAIDTYLFRGKAPWTLKNHADHLSLIPAVQAKPATPLKIDNKLTFDRLSSVYLSNTYHEENQPCHLQLQQPELALTINYAVYDSPESRYCPASVYEIVYTQDKEPKLQINAQNCLHCKTCDIKDPMQNIIWVTPEGGGGPNYRNM